jgi:hypothetical protein
MKILVEDGTNIVVNGEPRHKFRQHKQCVELFSDDNIHMVYHQYNKFNTIVYDIPKSKFPDDFEPWKFTFDGTNLTRIV